MSARQRRGKGRHQRGHPGIPGTASGITAWIRNSRHGYWLVGALILFGLSYFVTITRDLTDDESWFLQVVHRATSGDVLYRDVYFGATPLSVYLTATFTSLFGTEILVIKAVVMLCFVLIVLLCCRIARQCGSFPRFPLLLVLALFVYAIPQPVAPYNPLANLFLLGCFSASLVWRESAKTESGLNLARSRSAGALGMAGVAAGLCFAAKQNLGLYALAALLLTVVVHARATRTGAERTLVAMFLVLTAFVLSTVLVLLPVGFSGGTEKLLEYGFLGKGAYLRYGQVSYLEGLRGLASLLKSPASLVNLTEVHWHMQFLLPFLTFGALLVTWCRAGPEERVLATTVFLFVGAAFMGVFPRANISHLRHATPALLLGLSYAWYRIIPGIATPWLRLVPAGLLLWFGIGVGFMLMPPMERITSGNYHLSALPHFRGILMPRAVDAPIRTFAKRLAEEAGGEQVFFLGPYAGFYYLVSGSKNPTRFDFPSVTGFGRDGEADVAAAISRGQIRIVCLEPVGTSPLWPVRLVGYVQEHMERGRDLSFCTLYRNPTHP